MLQNNVHPKSRRHYPQHWKQKGEGKEEEQQVKSLFVVLMWDGRWTFSFLLNCFVITFYKASSLVLWFHLPPTGTIASIVYSYHGKSESSEGPLMLNHWKGKGGKKQNMQTSYSKWWLLYFILLKIGKGERSQLTFIALSNKKGWWTQVADSTTMIVHSPGNHQTLRGLYPLTVKFLTLNIFDELWILSSLPTTTRIVCSLLITHMEANWPPERERGHWLAPWFTTGHNVINWIEIDIFKVSFILAWS